MLKKKKYLFFWCIFLFLWPIFSSAQIIFSEIMYNPKGSDSGYEWVEIKNTNSFSLSLEKYKFCEGKPTCHSWAKDKNDNFQIEANGYAVITDDKDKFLEQNPNFNGLILVSTGFVLTNTGELIQIKNLDGDLDDSLTYNPDSNGEEGDTLSVFNNVWKNSTPTPGADNIYKDAGDNNSDGGENNNENKTNTSYVEISDRIGLKKKLKAEIAPTPILIAGARNKFYGRAYGLSGVEIYGIDFLWNYGDGDTDFGQEVYHSYEFPGEYYLHLRVKSGHFTGEDKVKVSVLPPDIELAEVVDPENKKNGYIKIKNNLDYSLNLGGWILFVQGEKFVIPDDTYIGGNDEIIFSSKITNLQKVGQKTDLEKVFLFFSNGKKVANFYRKEKEKSEIKNNKNKETAPLLKFKKEDYMKRNFSFSVVPPSSSKKDKEYSGGDVTYGKKKEIVINSDNFKKENNLIKKPLENQSANLLKSFQENDFREIILGSEMGFLQNNLGLVLSLLFLMALMTLLIYLKKLNLIREQEDNKYEELLENEAEGFEIEEIK